VKITSLFKKGLRPVLVVGLILAVFQQWCGINVVLNYAEELFSSADFEVSAILMKIVVTGVVTLIFCLLAILTIDWWGRRKLMLLGSLGLAILYSALGLSYLLNLEGTAVLVIIVLSVAVYSMTLAPVTWVVLSEIFPNRVRGIAMALATTMLWIASAVLVVTFPYFDRGLNAHGTFWLHAVICLAGFLFIYYRLPETKGKSLEEIEKEIGGGSPGK
jgi:MFS family permease